MPQGWEAPDGSRSVAFARGIVEGLRGRALEAFRSVPKRGAEIGGLILGRVLRTKPFLARVTGFEEIPCPYRFGPSYVLADEDLPALETALRQERPDPVIGFFRSYASREMLLDEADRNLLNRYSPDERSIFLLLQPKASASCAAAFLFPENGEVGWEPQYPAFDFDEARLSGQTAEPAQGEWRASAEAKEPPAPALVGQSPSVAKNAFASRILRDAGSRTSEPPREESPPSEPPVTEPPSPEPPRESAKPAVEVPAAVAVAETVPPPEPHHLPPPARVRQREYGDTDPPRKRGFLLPLLGWIVLCVAAAGVYELWTMARAPRWAPLGLNAQTTPGAIQLSWNAALRPVHDAARGTLIVDDGGAAKRIALTPEQVRAGRYNYQGSAGNVLFRMELSGGGMQDVGDSLRVVSAPPAKAAAPPTAEQPRRAESSADRAAERETPEERPANIAILPEPLREIHPDIPPGIRARIHDRVVVPVEVKVTATGRVVSASTHGSGDSLYHYLADRAARSARDWRFSPARARNGRAVPATRTIYFVFRGSEG
jgi:hypothetical protein